MSAPNPEYSPSIYDDEAEIQRFPSLRRRSEDRQPDETVVADPQVSVVKGSDQIQIQQQSLLLHTEKLSGSEWRTPNTSSRSHTTRNISIFVVLVAYVIGAALLGVAVWLSFELRKPEISGRNAYVWLHVNSLFRKLIPLAMNLFITLLVESTLYINSVHLRWTLQREGRLNFNSNLLLFTTTRTTWVNSWLFNVVSAVLIILAYTSSSLLFVEYGSSALIQELGGGAANLCRASDCTDITRISTIAMATLGMSLFGQAMLAICAFISIQGSQKVASWSSNALHNAQTYAQSGHGRHVGRSMFGIGENHYCRESMPVVPRACQLSASDAHPEAHLVIWGMWFVFGYFSLYWIAVFIGVSVSSAGDHITSEGSSSGWIPIPDLLGPTSAFAIVPLWRTFDIGLKDVDLLSLLLVIPMLQTPLTVGLQSIDLIVGLSQDEDSWKSAYKMGFDGKRSPIITAITTWKPASAFIAKSFCHWMFGLAVSYQIGAGIVIRPSQVMWLSVAVLLVAITTASVAKRSCRSIQPVAYGHLQTLIDLVDDWRGIDDKFFWGHKIDDDGNGYCVAGTSDRPLPRIRLDRWYR